MASTQIDILDGLSSSTAYKGPCRVVTTTPIALQGEQTIDGVAIVSGDRVLVRIQPTSSDNGIYIADTGLWRRAKDFVGAKDIRKGTRVWVTEGTSGPAEFEVTTENPVIVGASSIVFDLSAGSANAAALSVAAQRAEDAADIAEGFASDIVSQGNVPIYSTKSGMSALSVPVGINALRVNGYSASGDGGAALYKKAISQPVHDGKFQSSDGAWWEVAETELNADMFGAVRGTGLTSGQWETNRAAIQAMIDATMYGGLKSTPRLLNGVYEYSGTLHLNYGNAFKTPALIGQGRFYRGTSTGTGTALVHKGSMAYQAINIQGGRSPRIKGLTIVGQLYNALTALAAAGQTDESLWNAAGGNDRYAPYAGITLDAYAGVKPATFYPDVVYPAWTGVTAAYGKGFTSWPQFEDVEILGFNTGYVNQPCNTDGNGDMPTFRNCKIEACVYAISVGNTQCRNVDLNNVVISNVYSAFVNAKHGLQLGVFDGAMVDVSLFGFAAQIFDFGATSSLGSPTFINLYAEGLWKVGSVAGGATNFQTITFIGGDLKFSSQGTYGPPGWALSGTGSTVTFKGTAFRNFPSILAFEPVTHFDYCLARPDDRDIGTVSPYQALAHNLLCGGLMKRPAVINAAESIDFKAFNVDTGVVIGRANSADANNNLVLRINCIPVYMQNIFRANERSIRRTRDYRTVTKASFSSVTLVDRTLTLVFSAVTDAEAMFYGYNPGDVIFDPDTGSTFFIRSRTTTTVLAVLQNNYIPAAGGYHTAFNLASGSFEFLNSRIYIQSAPTTGDATSGSTILANVQNRAMSGAHISQIQVGDLSMDQDINFAFDLARATVTAVDGTAQTITFTGNARKSITRAEFELFARLPPANV